MPGLWWGFILLGLIAGVLGGLVGIGGGIIIVPVLALLFGFSQHLAQGTSLAALLPPAGILAAWMYYRQGHVDIWASGLICLGFVFGGLLGAKLATSLSTLALKRVFGGLLLAVAVKFLWGK